MTKFLTKVNIRKKGFVLIHALRVQFMARKEPLQERETTGHLALVFRNQGEMNIIAHLTF